MICTMKLNRLFLISVPALCLAFSSCSSGSRKAAADDDHIGLTTKTLQIPSSDVLNLKSYYLSCTCRKDTSEWLYAYNYKEHALDRFDLHSLGSMQIPLAVEGASAVVRPISGLYVCSPDSIWVYDAAQKALLLDGKGLVLRSVPLAAGLSSGQAVMIERNYAISTTPLYYDAHRRSLLFGIRDASGPSIVFKVREYFLDTGRATDMPLPASVDVPHVAEGDYADMSRPNLTFTAEKIVCNYPVESHIYVIDRRSGQTDVFEAPSRYTANKAEPCRSRTDYTQWERHRVENPHFYELMYLPASGRYVRLHTAGQMYDASKKLMDQLLEKRFFLTLFDHDFSVLDEEELPAHRYNIFTGWCPVSDALLFYVDHPLSGGEETEELVIDCIE